MRKLSLLFILIILGACSSTGKKVDKFEKKFEKISDNDFKKNTPLRYNSRKDFHPIKINKDLSPFIDETLSIVPIETLKNTKEDKGVITKIASLCYQKEIAGGLNLSKKHFSKYQSHPSYWVVVGNCYLLKGNNYLAQLYYSKALALKSKDPSVYNNFAVTLLKRGETDRALVAFEKAVSLDSSNSTTRLNLARLYNQYGLFDQALRQWKKLESRNSRNQEVIKGLATSYLQKGWYKSADKYFSRILANKNADPMVNYALNLHYLGQSQKALQVLDKIQDYPTGMWKKYAESVENYIRGKK
jgi:tetratricopeptide (TPR) repeat protein